MDHLEKVEELVAKAGCSYADAKEALERADWNMLDAIIALERDGKVEKASASFSTDGTEPEYTVNTQAMQRTNAGESESEEESASDSKQDGLSGFSRFKEACKEFFITVKKVLTMNFVTVLSKNGNQMLHIPIWIALIPLLVWFWGVLAVCLVMMVLGCKFHFEGRDFGKTGINETIDRASQAAYDAGQKVKKEFAGTKDNPFDSGNGEE